MTLPEIVVDAFSLIPTVFHQFLVRGDDTSALSTLAFPSASQLSAPGMAAKENEFNDEGSSTISTTFRTRHIFPFTFNLLPSTI